MEDGEDDNWEWKPEQEPSCGKKMSMNQIVHPKLNMCKWRQDWSIYLVFTTFLWLSLIPGSGFRLKKEAVEENYEDASEGVLRKTQQRNNLDKN